MKVIYAWAFGAMLASAVMVSPGAMVADGGAYAQDCHSKCTSRCSGWGSGIAGCQARCMASCKPSK